MNYNHKEAEFEIERLQSRVNHLTVTNHNVRQKNKDLIEALAAISNMCIGNVAMGYPLDAESIGQLIYQATGLTNPELNELTKGE